MGSVRIVLYLTAAVLLATTSCRLGTDEDGTSAPPKRISVPAAIRREGGVLYLVAGKFDVATDLYRLNIARSTLERVTKGLIPSSVTGCPESVIVNAIGDDRRGFATDRLHRVGRSGVGPVPGLGMPSVFVPALGRDCRLAFSVFEQRRLTDPMIARLQVFDPRTRKIATAVVDRDRVSVGLTPQWLRGGRLAYLRDSHSAPPRIVVGSGKHKRTFDPGSETRESGLFVASTVNDWMAFGEVMKPTGTVIFHEPSGRRVRDIRGWKPRAWDPDGRILLMSLGRRWALAFAPGFERVEVLGKSPTPRIIDAVWLARDPVAQAEE